MLAKIVEDKTKIISFHLSMLPAVLISHPSICIAAFHSLFSSILSPFPHSHWLPLILLKRPSRLQIDAVGSAAPNLRLSAGVAATPDGKLYVFQDVESGALSYFFSTLIKGSFHRSLIRSIFLHHLSQRLPREGERGRGESHWLKKWWV